MWQPDEAGACMVRPAVLLPRRVQQAKPVLVRLVSGLLPAVAALEASVSARTAVYIRLPSSLVWDVRHAAVDEGLSVGETIALLLREALDRRRESKP